MAVHFSRRELGGARLRLALVVAVAALAALVVVPQRSLDSVAATAGQDKHLNNGRLLFGGSGSTQYQATYVAETSVADNGLLKQPHYWNQADNKWYKLTFSSYPLDMAIGTGRSGSNWTGNDVVDLDDDGVVSDLQVTSRGFTQTGTQGDVNIGYGGLTSLSNASVNGFDFQVRHDFLLATNSAVLQIVTRVTNTSTSAASNVGLWVGTRDDYVGTDDDPSTTRGNLVNGNFVQLSYATESAKMIQITAGSEAVLFYSTSPGANTATDSCCYFSNSYNRNPSTSAISDSSNDGSYAAYLNAGDLAPGATARIVWYYAAGALADVTAVITEIASLSMTPEVENGNAQATITWNEPDLGGQTITGYVYRYRDLPSGSWTEVTVGASPTTATVSPLVNGTNYEFQVAAITTGDVRGTFSPSSESVLVGTVENIATPTISGDADLGSTLSVVDPDSNWVSHNGSAMTSTYQWQLNGVDIPGATGSTLSVNQSMVGGSITVVVTRQNSVGSASAASFSTPVVTQTVLTGVTTSAGALSPAFDPTVTSYTQQLEVGAESVEFRPVAASGTTMTVDGVTVSSGTFMTVSISSSSTPVTIVVTRGSITRTYTITFTRSTPVVALPPLITIATTVPPASTTIAPPTTVRPPATTTPVTTVPVSTSVPAPVPTEGEVLPELPPGVSQVLENGVPAPVEVFVQDSTDLVLRGDGFQMALAGECSFGCTIRTDPEGRQVLELEENGLARVEGEGFLPGTPVYVWLFSDPKFLGELTVNADGTFAGSVSLAAIEVGGHTLQVNGTSFDGKPRTANLGVLVSPEGVPSPLPTVLPATGTDAGLFMWVMLLTGLGGALVWMSRRRTVPTQR